MEDGHSNAGSKDYLVSLMFSHYDLNNNGLLEAQELSKVYYDYTYRSSSYYIELLRPLPISFLLFSISLLAHYSNDTRQQQSSRFPKAA